MNRVETQLYDAFLVFIREHQQDFYRLAFRYVHCQEAALDVVQEALEKGLRGLTSLREPAYMKTWFYRILVNESLTYLRRHRREVLPFEEALADLVTVYRECRIMCVCTVTGKLGRRFGCIDL